MKGVHLVGDVMYDAMMDCLETAKIASTVLERLHVEPQSYVLATVHRAENTDEWRRMHGIMAALAQLADVGHNIIFSVHPRTRKILAQHSVRSSERLRLIDPLPYLDMVRLESAARIVVTDSGGVQKEAYWLGVPCVTLREETEWVETLEMGWNRLAGSDIERILQAVREAKPGSPVSWPWKSGEASKRSASLIAG